MRFNFMKLNLCLYLLYLYKVIFYCSGHLMQEDDRLKTTKYRIVGRRKGRALTVSQNSNKNADHLFDF